ncbi:MAG: hypothetical protein GXY47_01290 [Acidobacteria bacterium]|nr:hypothetical protein [Acidobacteriota bacterium]
MEIPTLEIDPGLGPGTVRAALVWGLELPGCAPTAAVPTYIAELLERVRAAGEGFLDAGRRAAVRGMLRHGRFKPSGRSKPASEYLLAAALGGDFPLVNPPVDANNAVSLQSGYPASVFDLDLTGHSLRLRRGRARESYVFNPSGQEIGLEDLLCVCRRQGELWVPCGNPVKDSMTTKTREATRAVVAVVYAPAGESAALLEAAAERFSTLLAAECGAARAGWNIA